MKTFLNAIGIVALAVVTLGAQPSHNQKVSSEIRIQLDKAFQKANPIPVSTRIQTALAAVTSKRDAPGNSGDIVLRDAEYYLHGLYGAAARDWAHIVPTLGAPVYEAFKWVALKCKDIGIPQFEEHMRSQPGSPLSAPGGAAWAYRGLRDGFGIDGKPSVGPRSNGHGLSLPVLQAVAPCSTE